MYFSVTKNIFHKNTGLSLISVMISSVIAGIIITAMNAFFINSLNSQKIIEKRALRKELFDHYVFKLNTPAIKDFTKNNNSNSTLKAHVSGSSPQAFTTPPSSLTDIPSPIYPSGSNGITVYKTATSILIPHIGLLLNSTGAPCTPSPCTTQQAKWKVLVKWAALDNRGYNFYLSVSDVDMSNTQLQFKTYARLLSSAVPQAANIDIDVIQIIKDNLRVVHTSFGSYSSSTSRCRNNEIFITGYCSRSNPPSFYRGSVTCRSDDSGSTYAVCLGHNN